MELAFWVREGRRLENRDRIIYRAGIVTICGNVLLAAFKALVGAVAGSIAITLDAVNNLTDAISSIVAIVGTKLASRPANRKHPFGYGRMEYVAALAIAALIVAAGVTALISSVQAIVEQPVPAYDLPTFVVVGAACAAKIALGLYQRHVGTLVDSSSLLAASLDSLMDAVASAGTLAAALAFATFGLNVEAWVAAVIALLIVKNGLEMLSGVISKVLGERVDPSIVSRIEESARSVDGVAFASGLVLQDFGPERVGGSLFVTVDGQMSVADFDAIAREVQQRVEDDCGIQLICVGAYPADVRNEDAREVRSSVGRIVWGHDQVLELRGLHVDMERQVVRFDAIVDFGERDTEQLRREIVAYCEDAQPGWAFDVRVLPDVGD